MDYWFKLLMRPHGVKGAPVRPLLIQSVSGLEGRAGFLSRDPRLLFAHLPEVITDLGFPSLG